MNYNFCINDFEGPLDLLLHLVKESKMDIYEINISTIIEQYLEFIHSLKEKNIDVASEYLVMASELVHLKSKLLINKEETEDSEEEDLKEKIIEYEKYKQISKSLLELEEKRNEVYTKIPENLKELADIKRLPKGIFDLEDLYEAYLAYLKRKKLERPINTKITRKELSIDDRINYIRNILVNNTKVEFFDLFETFNRENIVVTFLSILEMAKKDEILISQEDNFSPIIIEKRA